MELKGSNTEKNLQAAFAGESQARNKYTYFAAVAKKGGLEEIAGAFLEAAENEKVHAQRELELLQGIGDTEANLKAAAGGENHECTAMYPEFERIAREEGFTEIADFFNGVASIEEKHEEMYLSLLRDLREGKLLKKEKETKWKCRNCGWIKADIEAPNDCPVCKAPRTSMVALDSGSYKFM